MSHLIVFAHPHEESFNHAILDAAVGALKGKGQEVVVRDLYKLGFNPVLSSGDTAAMRAGNTPEDIKTEQDYVRQAETISFIYPIWWTGLPAVIKGYVDRVFSYGFAYAYNAQGAIDKLLTGKRGLLVSTYGTPEEYYRASGMLESLKQTSDQGIFDFCGIQPVDHLLFGGVTSVDDAARKAMLKQVETSFSSL
ncbi:NAD(P)H dehydrogenase (quinone) [Paenibacillus phyllosphaerae]|uniref:NAD(P)H dehydrogenase (Quinone) n=1 Tax=Paenibacillus phyllosphaerae TaxID=274593 RepID=A0A7W5FLB0_9BACL|nr:NAD(P)H-dependent oxidoreductase [Paenibacillus phyllosphaerae]MBB3108807.1 NAD(P)H dehydrogenase (quinone) [Paenibacillus phyllosphaerae]